MVNSIHPNITNMISTLTFIIPPSLSLCNFTFIFLIFHFIAFFKFICWYPSATIDYAMHTHEKIDFTKYSAHENIQCWANAIKGILWSAKVPEEAVRKVTYCFHGKSVGTNTRELKMKFLLFIIDVYPFVVVTYFFSALRAQLYDDEVSKWVLGKLKTLRKNFGTLERDPQLLSNKNYLWEALWVW